MENGGQNLYVSKNGVLQRIFQFDINNDGYPDLLFANSQSMNERPPVHIYKNPLESREHVSLPSCGTYTGIFADLFHSGCDDLILACQNNGTHTDLTAILYFGGPEGLSERCRMELPAPNAIDVAAGDFNHDGRMELVFVSNDRLRLFFQRDRGFNPADFIDYDIPAACLAATDLDGDGFCDLIIKDPDGNVGVVFGSSDYLNADGIVWLRTSDKKAAASEGSSTAGMAASRTEWQPSTIVINGKTYFSVIQGKDICLYRCKADRTFERDWKLCCPNAISVAAADLTGNGFDDLAVAVFRGRDETAACRIYLGSEYGLSENSFAQYPVKGAVSVTIARLPNPCVVFCRTGETVKQEVASPVLEVDVSGAVRKVSEIVGGDCIRILAGRPDGNENCDELAVLNHKMNRLQGGENIYIYLGSKDGYQAGRRIELPGHSAVEGTMCDFFDRGHVDVLVTNSFEDATFLDDGSYLYLNDGKKVDPSRKINIPTVRAHGCAVGDFRKSGYLDIAFGGFRNRELRIFHGSENGYCLENCTKIVLGPDEGNYEPYHYTKGEPWAVGVTEDEEKRIAEFGQVRWLMAADFNSDGWLDLFVSEILGPRSFIFWGGPEGFSKKRMTVLETDGVASAAVADLTGNGYPDLLLAQHMSTKKNMKYESYITVYWGGADGYSENRKMQLPANCANSVTVGDYNGNGLLDIYATSYNNGRSRDLLSFLYKNKNGSFSAQNVQYLFNHSASGCVSGDFNGDGYTDLAVACHKEYGNHCSHSFIFWGGPDGLSEDRKTILPTIGPHGMCTVDPGNIMDRGDKERYTSEIKKIPDGSIVREITWEGECSSTSWVEVELRAAASLEKTQTAEWIKVRANADLTNCAFSGYIQYRLSLCARCGCGTPRITKVIVRTTA